MIILVLWLVHHKIARFSFSLLQPELTTTWTYAVPSQVKLGRESENIVFHVSNYIINIFNNVLPDM